MKPESRLDGASERGVAVVILNWNGWRDTIACLGTVLANAYQPLRVLVCDNGSSDGSMGQIRRWALEQLHADEVLEHDRTVGTGGIYTELVWRSDSTAVRRLVLIQNGSNLGFARGFNVGFRYAWERGFEFICAMNNGVTVGPEFVRDMRDAFQDLNPSVAVVGPKILDRQGRDWQRPERYRPNVFTWMLRALAFRRAREVGWSRLYRILWCCGDEPEPAYLLQGSCLFFRGAMLREIGGFDEGTFLYWEEAIVREKLRRRGWGAYFVPQVVITHAWGQSTAGHAFTHFVRSAVYYFRDFRRVGWFSLTLLKFTLLVWTLRSYMRDRSDGSMARLKEALREIVRA